MNDKIHGLILGAIDEISDPDVLAKLRRRVERRLKAVSSDAPATTPSTGTKAASKPATKPTPDTSGNPYANMKEGDKVKFGTEHGEQTLARVLKVNRRRLKVETLEQRGRKKVSPAGTQISIDPRTFKVEKVEGNGARA